MDPIWPQSANLIWPKDHSWCVATEIDWDSTLIAGPYPVTQAILDDERLETFEVDYGDDLPKAGTATTSSPLDWLRARR